MYIKVLFTDKPRFIDQICFFDFLDELPQPSWHEDPLGPPTSSKSSGEPQQQYQQAPTGWTKPPGDKPAAGWRIPAAPVPIPPPSQSSPPPPPPPPLQPPVSTPPRAGGGRLRLFPERRRGRGGSRGAQATPTPPAQKKGWGWREKTQRTPQQRGDRRRRGGRPREEAEEASPWKPWGWRWKEG